MVAAAPKGGRVERGGVGGEQTVAEHSLPLPSFQTRNERPAAAAEDDRAIYQRWWERLWERGRGDLRFEDGPGRRRRR